jgi:hypothetical protein
MQGKEGMKSESLEAEANAMRVYVSVRVHHFIQPISPLFEAAHASAAATQQNVVH